MGTKTEAELKPEFAKRPLSRTAIVLKNKGLQFSHLFLLKPRDCFAVICHIMEAVLPSPRQSRVTYVMLGIVLGGLAIGLPCLFFMFLTQYHYHEESVFFRAKTQEGEVQGVAFMDYHGLGFLEGVQWKVQLLKPDQAPVLMYQNKSRFQQTLPHQPDVMIEGNQMTIKDGLNHLTVAID